MLFGCPPSVRGASSAVGQRWSNAETLASSLTFTIQSGPAPSTSGVYNMVCGPPPCLDGFTQSLSRTHATETSVRSSDGQQRRMSNPSNHKNEHNQRQSSKRPSGAEDVNHSISSQNIPSKSTNIEADNPILYDLLTTDNRKDAWQSLQSQPSVSTSANTTSVRALPSGSKPYLGDDQILRLIAETLSQYRTEMKALQAMSTGTSNSSAPVKALEDNPQVCKDKEASAGCKQDSEMPFVKGITSATAKQSEGTLLSNSSHDMQFVDKSAEYFDLDVKAKDLSKDQQWTHTYSKDSYSRFLGHVGTLHYSLTALKERVGSLDNVQMNATSMGSSFDNTVQQYWNGKMDNVHLFTSTEHVGIMQDAAAICAKTEEQSRVVLTALSGTTADELTTRNSRMTLNCKPSDEEYKSVWQNVNTHLDTDKEASLNTHNYIMKGLSVNATETSKEQKSSEDATVDSVGLKQKPHRQEPSKQIQTQEKIMQAGDGKIEKQDSGLGYVDIKNEEVSNATPQISMLDISSQFEDISDDESPVLGASEQFANPEPTEVIPLDTSAHYEDISEEENAEPSQQVTEGNSESAQLQETYELKQLTCCCPYFVETEDGFEESLCPKCVQDIPSISSGVQTAIDNMKDESDSNDEWLVIPLIPTEVKLIDTKEIGGSDEENQDLPYPVQDNQLNVFDFQKIPVYETLESLMEQMKPRSLEASDNPPSELHHIPPEPEAEDSCETDDSSDYPLQTKPNYLTPSSRLKVPSPRPQDSDDADDEVPQTSKSTRSYVDDDDLSRNTTSQVSVKSTSKVRPIQEQTQEKPQTGKKAKFKSRVIYSDSDTDDERTPERSCSFGSSKQKKSSEGAYIQSSKVPEKTVKKTSPVCQKFKKSSKETNNGQPGLQKQAIKRKLSSTGDDCKKAKMPWSSTGASSIEAKMMSEKNARSPPQQDSHKNNPQNVPKVTQKNGKPVSQLSPPNQSLNSEHRKLPGGTRSPVRKTLSVDGAPHEASSLPGRKPSPLARQKSYISKLNQVNSYSTASSTEAKKQLVKHWESEHVPTRMERKNSMDKDSRTARGKAAHKGVHESVRELHSGPSYNPAPRQRHNSQEIKKPLMKKTMLEAQQWTQARCRQTPSKNGLVGEGYKWSEKSAARPPCGSGHRQRPHH